MVFFLEFTKLRQDDLEVLSVHRVDGTLDDALDLFETFLEIVIIIPIPV